MAFGSTVTVTVNAVAHILNRINQDTYGSEFYLREATMEWRMKVRHTKESPNKDGFVFNRHNVELTQTVFATSTMPALTRQAYSVYRNMDIDTTADPAFLFDGFVDYMDGATVSEDLVAWMN
jgi:hypothetical protein